jgi:hypothetical protein
MVFPLSSQKLLDWFFKLVDQVLPQKATSKSIVVFMVAETA